MGILGRTHWIAGWGLLAFLLATSGVTARASTWREYDLKAAFLLNFASFVHWPESAFASAEAPLVIGVVGEDPFGGILDEVVAGERVNGHPIEVRRYSRGDAFGEAHILYIARSEQAHLSEILQACAGRAVLTVSDIPAFVWRGGMIGFTTQGNRIALHINLARTERSALEVSSKLLRVAQVVHERGGEF